MNYKQTVFELLQKYDSAKDDDLQLYSLVLARFNFDVVNQTAFELICLVREKNLPSLDSITRLRRMVQMENPSLRGQDWDLRHGKKVEKALTDLGYVNA